MLKNLHVANNCWFPDPWCVTVMIVRMYIWYSCIFCWIWQQMCGCMQGPMISTIQKTRMESSPESRMEFTIQHGMSWSLVWCGLASVNIKAQNHCYWVWSPAVLCVCLCEWGLQLHILRLKDMMTQILYFTVEYTSQSISIIIYY